MTKSTAASAEALAVINKTQAQTKSSNPAGIVKRTNAYFADPLAIRRRPGFNPRFDFGEIDELAKSIKVNGLLQPLRVKRCAPSVLIHANNGVSVVQEREGGAVFELIDGDRRLTAIAVLLKQGHAFPDGVPVIVVDAKQDDVTSLIQMFEANTGKNFLPLEEAQAYKRMRDAGMTIKQICEAVSRKHVHVVATMALLEADADVQEAVKSGAVTGTTAKQIAVAARGDKTKQKELVAQAKAAGKDKLKKAELEKSIQKTRADKAAAKGKTIKMRALSDAELSAIGTELAKVLTAKLKDAGKPLDFDVREWVKKDDQLALAFTFGALEALKAAAGMIVPLDI